MFKLENRIMSRILCVPLALALCGCADDASPNNEGGQEGDAGEVVPDVPSVDEVSWAIGWWRNPEEVSTAHEGAILAQLELTEDGRALQRLEHCFTQDESYEGSWAPITEDRVALLPATGDETMPWMGSGSLSRVELTLDEEGAVLITRVSRNGDNESSVDAGTYVFGRRCMSEVVVSDCVVEMCGE
jgi:hypothetical protein